MNPTPFDQIEPGHIARSDQGLAMLHERVNRLGKAIAVAIYPTPGDMCRFPECDKAADIVVVALYGLPERTDVPACNEHYDGGAALEPILMGVIEARGLAVEPGVQYMEELP